jgi:uncharacterized surface protein with fasciclin (FAS1) repeats
MKYGAIFSVFATAFLGMAVADDTMTIVETAAASGVTNYLYAALQTAGLTDAFDDGNFTVFAPTDTSFAGLDSTLLATLMADTDLLSPILQYHVLVGTVMSADISSGVVSTLSDNNLLVVKRNNIRLNEKVKVTTSDIVCSNGVIHLIDTVLTPPGDLVVELDALGNYATLIEVVSMFSDLVSAFTNTTGGSYTVFAPTDEAFEAIASIIPNLTEDQIRLVLLHHVVEGNVASFDLEVGAEVLMMSGQNVTIGSGERTNAKGELKTRATVDDKFIIDYNNMASNGVIHIIEEVLIPDL